MTITADTSAVIAVLLGEEDAEAFARVLSDNAGDVLVGTATLVEMRIVALAKQGDAALADLDLLLRGVEATIVPFDRDQADCAADAWSRFGRGRHPAALNLGDCYSYAVARVSGAPLLFKGKDFSQTDIARAI